MAGLTMNSRASEEIYQSLLAYRRYPALLFTGSDESTGPLRLALKAAEALPAR
jgi:hypothetical protein